MYHITTQGFTVQEFLEVIEAYVRKDFAKVKRLVRDRDTL